MGFLLGAYGKLAAGSRYRSLQAKMMRIQSRLRRCTRDVANMEKMLDRQEKAMKNNAKLEAQAAKSIFNDNLNAVFGGVLSKMGGNASAVDQSGLSAEDKAELSRYQQAQNNFSFTSEWNTTQTNQQIEDYFEQLRELQLDPLKDEEDSLQLEKDSLESQITVAKQDYEACKEMEKSDAQMLKPSYTGGGQ